MTYAAYTESSQCKEVTSPCDVYVQLEPEYSRSQLSKVVGSCLDIPLPFSGSHTSDAAFEGWNTRRHTRRIQ